MEGPLTANHLPPGLGTVLIQGVAEGLYLLKVTALLPTQRGCNSSQTTSLTGTATQCMIVLGEMQNVFDL